MGRFHANAGNFGVRCKTCPGEVSTALSLGKQVIANQDISRKSLDCSPFCAGILAEQILAYRASDVGQRAAGLVREVKGERHLARRNGRPRAT